MTQTPLAIALPVLGQRSETFIKKHAEEILPGRTSLIASFSLPEDQRAWDIDGPKLMLDPRWRPLRGAVKLFRSRISQAGTEHKVIDFLKSHGVQAIVVEYADSFLSFVEPIQAAGIRWYTFGHGYDVSERLLNPDWRARYQIHNQVSGVFVRANVIKQRLIDIGLREDLISVVRGGVDVPETCPVPQNRSVLNLLAVGRMVPKKNPIKSIEAFATALLRCPNMHLHYIGDGPMFADAKELVSTKGVDSKITLYGGKPSDFVMRQMRETDIYIQHSMRDPSTGDEEGLPAAITEAMAHGIPVVSTLHAGIPEAIDDGSSGYLVEEGDSDSMAERIVRLAKSFELRQKMGREGWQKARTVFNWENERKQILELTGLGES